MDKSKSELSELLAFRDGEPYDTGLVNRESMAEQGPVLGELVGLKAELQNLPDVPLDEGLWAEIQRRAQPASGPRGAWMRWQQYPLATAASVFLVSAVAMYGLFAGLRDVPEVSAPIEFVGLNPAPAGVQGGNLKLAALMNRSRDLEQMVYGDAWRFEPPPPARRDQTSGPTNPQPGHEDVAVSPLAQFILYQLGSVDARIAHLHESEQVDMSERQALWQQRVSLLQALVAEMADANPGDFVDSRSM